MTYRYPGGLIRRTAANTAITGASGVWDLGSQAQAVRNNTWPISGLALPVSGSLRFRASVSPYLTRTQGTSTNQSIATWSFWAKRGTLGTQQRLFEGHTASSDTGVAEFEFGSDNTFLIGGWSTNWRITTQVFRDPSAWYHFVVVFDTTQATANNRVRVYVNGSEVTAFSTTSNPTQNSTFGLNNNSAVLQIGRRRNTVSNDSFFDGYMAEINVIDGQALTPASFGQTSAITGVWEPIKYTGTYGTNGFYLSLSDTSSIGKDFSGNGNNWTPNNISTANDSTFDLMRDVPTQYTPQGSTDVGGVVRGNYCTLNPLLFVSAHGYSTLSNGNLTTVGNSATNNGVNFSTQAVKTGKWYAEFTCTGSSGSYPMVGITDITQVTAGANAGGTPGYTPNSGGYIASGFKTLANGTQYSYGNSFTTNDVIGVAVDADNGALYFSKNGVFQNSGVPTSGASKTGAAYTFTGGTIDFYIAASPYQSGTGFHANFGQRPFAYTPPSGFKSLCTTNLPTPTIGATVATAANKNFDILTWTGTSTSSGRTFTGLGFQPDFVWSKLRNVSGSHQLYDAVRGTGKRISSNLTDAETTNPVNGYISAFNSDGFTTVAGSTNNGWWNELNSTYVGWNWNAGGSTVTNTAGSISAQVRANPTAGFSVVTYTGNGTGGATIGHGLGAAPSMLMFKNRDETGGNSILVWHTGFNTNQGQMLLSSTAAIYNPGNGLYFNSTTPGASVVTLGTSGATNASAQNMLMYAWTPVAGFSAFGSYTGNGSSDGPFIFTGFRPRFVMFKGSTIASNWCMLDAARNTYNLTDLTLQANDPTTELTNLSDVDFLSNGIKIRDVVTNDTNISGQTYIYMAFAEFPFKNSLAR